MVGIVCSMGDRTFPHKVLRALRQERSRNRGGILQKIFGSNFPAFQIVERTQKETAELRAINTRFILQ